MKKITPVYITVRIDIEHDENLSQEEVEEVISEADYSFEYSEVDAEIIDTEICGINQEY